MFITLENVSGEQLRKLKENKIEVSVEDDKVLVDINGDNTKHIVEALNPTNEIIRYGEEKIKKFLDEHNL